MEKGEEKIKELEAEIREMGLYDTDFSLGDVLDDGDDEEQPGAPEKQPKKKKLDDFPEVEGEESTVEYIGQYKRACLNRKALLKSTKERLERDKAVDYESLGCIKCHKTCGLTKIPCVTMH